MAMNTLNVDALAIRERLSQYNFHRLAFVIHSDMKQRSYKSGTKGATSSIQFNRRPNAIRSARVGKLERQIDADDFAQKYIRYEV